MFYNATEILGIGQSMSAEIQIWYGGWSLKDLRDRFSTRNQSLILNQDYKYVWGTDVLPIGLYALRLPMTQSCWKGYKRQLSLLADADTPAHPVLLFTAEICCLLQDNQSLVNNFIIRTGIQRKSGHIAVQRYKSQLKVFRLEDNVTAKNIVLASARLIAS